MAVSLGIVVCVFFGGGILRVVFAYCLGYLRYLFWKQVMCLFDRFPELFALKVIRLRSSLMILLQIFDSSFAGVSKIHTRYTFSPRVF